MKPIAHGEGADRMRQHLNRKRTRSNDMTVTLYSKPACVQCQATERRLTKLGVPYVKIDVTEDEKALARILAWGYQQVPVVDTGTAHWSGYRPDCLNGLATRMDDAYAAMAQERNTEEGRAEYLGNKDRLKRRGRNGKFVKVEEKEDDE